MLTEIKTFTAFIGQETTIKGFDDLATILDKKMNEYLTSDELRSIEHEINSHIVTVLPSTPSRTEGLLYQVVIRYAQI